MGQGAQARFTWSSESYHLNGREANNAYTSAGAQLLKIPHLEAKEGFMRVWLTKDVKAVVGMREKA